MKKNTRRLTTFCLTGALTLASGGALAAGNRGATGAVRSGQLLA